MPSRKSALWQAGKARLNALFCFSQVDFPAFCRKVSPAICDRIADFMNEPKKQWPAFDLIRLLRTVFAPKAGERLGILIDLPDPGAVRHFAFLRNRDLEIQRLAHDLFYLDLKKAALNALNLRGA